MRRFVTLLLVCVCLMPLYAQKIDFNLEGRQPRQVTANGYLPWAIHQSQKETKVIDRDKNILLTVAPEKNGQISCVWWKDGVQRHDRLVGDGLGCQAGVLVTISGLSAGSHSLLAYHNNVSTGKAPAIDVFVDGVKKLENVEQTSRALRATDAGQSYLTFDVKKGKDVVIVYRPQSEAALNGMFSYQIVALAIQHTCPTHSDRYWQG